jgi:hypothetical protein
MGVLALLCLPAAGAVGRTIGPRKCAAVTTDYRGGDGSGHVGFTLHTCPALDSMWIRPFHFANPCSPTGTTVNVRIYVGPRHRFHYNANGTTIHGQLKGIHLERATGTVRFLSGGCDSGLLSFTARALLRVGRTIGPLSDLTGTR